MPQDELDNPNTAAPSTVAIGKHPLHPAVVDFAVAFLSAPLLSDLVYWRTGEAFWAEFSFWLIAAGWLTGIGGVISGLIDFLTIQRAREHAAGWAHFILTDLAVFLATFNLISRLYNRQDSIVYTGLGMSAVVAVFVLLGGYFGGQLVFRHRIGVYSAQDTQAGEG